MARTKHRKAGKPATSSGFGVSKVLRERGRPARPLPPRIDATPEEMARRCSDCRLITSGSTRRTAARSIGAWNAVGKWHTRRRCTTMTVARNATLRRQLTGVLNEQVDLRRSGTLTAGRDVVVRGEVAISLRPVLSDDPCPRRPGLRHSRNWGHRLGSYRGRLRWETAGKPAWVK